MLRGLVLALMILAGVVPLGAQQDAVEAPARVSLETRDTPLRGALRLLQAQSKIVYRLESSVPNVPVSVSLRNVLPEDLLRVVVRQAAGSVPGLRVRQMGDKYEIQVAHDRVGEVQVPAPPEALAPPTLTQPFLRKVSVGFRNEGLHPALARVFNLVGVPFTIEPNVPNAAVTADVRNGTIWQALLEVLRAGGEDAQLELGQIGEVYVVALRPAPLATDPAAAKPLAGAPERITLKLDGVPLRLAADALFQGTSYHYTLTPDRTNVMVNLDLRNVPLELALNRLSQEALRLGVRLTWSRR